MSDFENISIAVGNLAHTQYLRLLSLPRARDVLLDTRIEYIIIANIILLPSIPPGFPSQAKGTAVTSTRIFFCDFLQLEQVPNDVNSLSIQAKVSAVPHVGNILCFVMWS